MTTYQDPPPQSRRAARNSERASERNDIATEQATEMWDTTARRVASLPQTLIPQATPQASTPQTSTPQTPVAPTPPTAPVSGRRAAPAPDGEPLQYITQQRPADPVTQFRPRGSTPSPGDQPLAPTEAMPTVDQPAFRVRDYSPEGRATAPSTPVAAPEWTQPYDPHTDEADLAYQTERRSPVAPVSSVPESIAPVSETTGSAPVHPPISELPAGVAPERTLTRRELRAIVQAEQETAAEPLPLVAPEPKPTTGLTNAISEFDALMARAAAAGPIPTESTFRTPDAQASTTWEQAPDLTAPDSAPSTAGDDSPGAAATDDAWTSAGSPQSAHAETLSTGPVAPAAEFITVPEQRRSEIAEPEGDRQDRAPDPAAPWTPPTGHWAAQLTEDEIFETTVNRTIGSSTLTTNALVLPSTPDTDIRGPLTSTGEILLTGSIDLPLALASTGVSSRIEKAGIDQFFETHDAESVSTDSQPVSAIRAVSTQSGSGLSHAPRPKGGRALTALLIAAVSMGVVVVGLFGLALALGAFS